MPRPIGHLANNGPHHNSSNNGLHVMSLLFKTIEDGHRYGALMRTTR